MTALDLLTTLRERGVTLTAMGSRLRVDAPKGALSETEWRGVADRKTELLYLLTGAEPDAGGDRCESELTAAQAAVGAIDSFIQEKNSLLLELCAREDWPTARALQTEIAELVSTDWLPARRRLARALDRLGRLPESDHHLVVSVDDGCVICGSPLAPTSKVLCPLHAGAPDGRDSP